MSKKKKKKKVNIVYRIIVAIMALLMIASPIIAGLATVIKKWTEMFILFWHKSNYCYN